MNCWKCGRTIETIERVGFRARCPSCDQPMHACLNCDFYDPAYNNQCRENQADRVVDKDRANFCEFFKPRKIGPAPIAKPGSDTRARLDALFKKKS